MTGPLNAFLTVEEALSMLPSTHVVRVATATTAGWEHGVLTRSTVEDLIRAATTLEHAWDSAARDGMALVMWHGSICRVVEASPLPAFATTTPERREVHV